MHWIVGVMRYLVWLVALMAPAACVDAADADETQEGAGGSVAQGSSCVGTCSTHFDGSTGFEELCGLQGALTNYEGTLYCDDDSSCATLKSLHVCMNGACSEACAPTPPSMVSASCRSCLEEECGGELDGCLADVP